MKTYPRPAVQVEWYPNGAPQTVTRLATIASPDATTAINLPQQLTLRGETTKRGLRRVVLRIESKVNNCALSQYGTTFKGPDATLSAHLVVQMPECVARTDGASATENGMLSAVLEMVANLFAVATNESPTGASDLNTDGLLSQALQGNETMEVISGSYGTASA